MEPLRKASIVRFGIYEVSFESGEVRKGSMRIKIQQQPLKVLEILLQHPGEIVKREVLRSRVWPGEEFGDFDQAVTIAIAKLRSAFGDSAENPRFIETVPKRGYRFIAEVSTVEAGVPANIPEFESRPGTVVEERLPTVPSPAATERGTWLTRWVVSGLVLFAIVLLAAIWFFRARNAQPKIRSLVVLPLEDLSGDASREYFADGMTDALITDLAQIRALRVISRTSAMVYKGARKPLPEIARELNVDAVVEGTVIQDGDRVRITAQLIQVPADKHLWAQSYDGNLRDTLALQKKVAEEIAGQIRIEVTPQEQAALKSGKRVDPDAYEAYLKGRYFWNKRTAEGLLKARDYFNAAVARDPAYAAAYSGLADTYALLGDWQYGVMTAKEALPKAEASAQRALELDDSLSEAHTSLAFCLEGFDWNWEAADKAFRRAIDLNPGYATAHHWYAWHLSLMGRNDEALAEMRTAKNLDPLSLIINADLAELLLIANHLDESIDLSRKTIEMDSSFALAHYQLGQAYIEKGKYEDAITELHQAIELSGGSPTSIANLARAFARSNQKAKALRLLEDLKETSTTDHPHSTEIAIIYAALGDHDQATSWLERGFEERVNPGVLLRPGFNPLRTDSRFLALRRRIGLPV